MPVYELVRVRPDVDLACYGCDRAGRSWAYRAEIIVRASKTSYPGDDYQCWRCHDEWRDLPEREVPVVKPVRPATPFGFHRVHDSPSDESRVSPVSGP